jgi:hypothetical protein
LQREVPKIHILYIDGNEGKDDSEGEDGDEREDGDENKGRSF